MSHIRRYYNPVNKKWKEEVPASRPIDEVDGQMSQDEFLRDVGALCAHFLFNKVKNGGGFYQKV